MTQNALDQAAARSAAGLVPSINKWETTVDAGLPEVFELDRLQARCTRLRKNLGVAAKSLSQSGGVPYMLTFTYRDDVEWSPKHVSLALANLRKWLKREHGARLRYIWVLETQDRKSGARVGEQRPHYHCIVWVPLRVSLDDLKLDQRGFWPHGLTNAVKAVAPVRYVMKYATKFDSEGAFPKGARCYGIGGLDDVGVRCRRWINWPSFVQARASVQDRWDRAPGGGWADRSTGEWLPSEWGLSGLGRQSTRLVRLRTHAAPWRPAGPFSWAPGAKAVH